MADKLDDAIAAEFDALTNAAGLDIAPARMTAMRAGYCELRHLLQCLHRTCDGGEEPAHVFRPDARRSGDRGDG